MQTVGGAGSGFSETVLNEWQPLHAPRKMENGVCSDQHRPASPGECQPNQAVSGDCKAGVLVRRDLYNAALAAQRRCDVEISLGIESQALRPPESAIEDRDCAMRINAVNCVKAGVRRTCDVQRAIG